MEDRLKTLKLDYEYEKLKLKYLPPPPKVKTYTPDFTIGSVILEVKGYLDFADQQKMLHVKACNPSLDIRFVFQKPHQKLPHRVLTHAQWAEKHGFLWCSLEELNKKWLRTSTT